MGSAYNPEHDKARLRGHVQDSKLRPHLRRRALDLATLDALARGIHMAPESRVITEWAVNTTITAMLDYMRAAGFALLPVEQIKNGQTAFTPTCMPLETECPPNAYTSPDLDPATADLPPLPQLPTQPAANHETQTETE